jgi:hypothetical protein
MTFEEWWATLTTREQARMVKEDVLEAWNTSQASEREACAKVCEDISDEYQKREGHKYPEMKTDAQSGASDCVYAILARSEKEVK